MHSLYNIYSLRIALRKICLIFVLALCAGAAHADGKKFVLVIDAGHGGHDAGAVGIYSREKDINLKVALEFGKLVKQNCPDVKVIYTRSTDVFIPLYQRPDIANKAKADLFVSIHTNSVPKDAPRTARGVETFTNGVAQTKANMAVARRENSVILLESDYKKHYQGFDNSPESYIIFEVMQDQYMEKSIELARDIQKQLKSGGRIDRGVHQASLAVLRMSAMPSVLVEVGFISTPAEEDYLNTAAGISTISRCIYNGFVNYCKKHDRAAAAIPEVKVTETQPEKEVKPSEPAQEPKEGKVENREPQQDTPAAKSETEAKKKETEAPKKNSDAAKKDSDASKKDSDVSKKDSDASKKDSDASKKDAPVNKKETEGSKKDASAEKPIFKVQLFVCERKLKQNDARLKGLSGVEYYQDGGAYKYTYGSTDDYNEIKRLQKSIADKFKDTFIVAFKNGQRIDLQNAIKESRKK